MEKSLFEETVKDRITYLEELIVKEEKASKWNEYLDDLEFLNEILYSQDEFSFYSYTDKFKTEASELLKRNYLWRTFKSFETQTNKVLDIIPNEKKYEISNTDLFEITHDFFKYFDQDYFNNFLKIYNNRNSHTKFIARNKPNLAGENYYIPSLDENFSIIYRSFTIDDIFTVIHESTHGTSALINPYHNTNTKDLFAEVDSTFMELVASDYIDKLFNNTEGTLNRIHTHDSHCCNGIDINDMIRLTKLVGTKKVSISLLENIARNRLFIEPQELRTLLDFNYTNKMSRLLGYMIAIQLYEIYKKDPDKAKFIFKRFILNIKSSEKEYYEWFLEEGINPSDNIKKYHNNINQDIQRLTRKPNNL